MLSKRDRKNLVRFRSRKWQTLRYAFAIVAPLFFVVTGVLYLRLADRAAGHAGVGLLDVLKLNNLDPELEYSGMFVIARETAIKAVLNFSAALVLLVWCAVAMFLIRFLFRMADHVAVLERTDGPLPTEHRGAEFLRLFLHDRDVKCPLCDYNLRDSASCACPECGNQLELTVGPIDLIPVSWICLIVALCLPAGIGIVLSGLAIEEGAAFFNAGAVPNAVRIYFMVCVILAAFAIGCRARFFKLAPHLQRVIATIVSIATGLALFLFFLV